METPISKKHALELSVEHWKENYENSLQGKVVRLSAGSCPCCQFAMSDAIIHCENCLIAEYTGEKACFRTPYYRARQSFGTHLTYGLPSASKEIIKEMYVWLRDLRDGKNPEIASYLRYPFE